jgi:hypothetical protein
MDSALKELLKVLPPFTAPVRTWAERIELLIGTDKPNDALNKAILSRLPTHLLDQLRSHTCATPKELLNKIVALEDISQPQAAKMIFSPPADIPSQQLPSAHYYEQLRIVRTAFPSIAADQISHLAWEKTMGSLPTQLRNLLLVLPESSKLETKLNMIDRAWQHGGTPTESVNASVTPTITAASSNTTIDKAISDLSMRLEGIEAALRERPRGNPQYPRYPPKGNSEETICYFHRKFGKQARNCQSPCRFRQYPAK